MLNPTRLTAARKRLGWTVTRLAAESGLSTRSVSSYENGRQVPTPSVESRLARTLGVRPAFLTGDDLGEVPVQAVSFRALSKMTARTRDRGLASGRIAIMLNDWIEERFELPAADIPTLPGHEPEAAAQLVRLRWGLGERPIATMVHLLEAHGVRVYSLPHAHLDLDAFCLSWEGRPFILLARQKTPERSRFDAAHELGHLVLHGGDVIPHGPHAEAEANRFAAALLMPAAGVLAQGITNPTARQLLAAKQRWSVAASAMARRFHELGLTSDWTHRNACLELARLGYRTAEPEGLPAHETSQLLTKVMTQLRSEGSGVRDISTAVGLSPPEIQSYLFGLSSGLMLSVPPEGATTRHL